MADGVVGHLRAVLGLETAEFDKNLAGAQKKLGSFSVGRGVLDGFKHAEGGIRGVAAQAGLLGSALSGMGLAGAAAGATIVGAMAGVRRALAFGDEIGDTANRLAVTTDALQEYRYAVHQLGGDYADADAALAGFSKAFGAAHAQLTKKAVKPFEALGLDPQAFGSTEDALQAVIEKIAALKSTAEQAAIADKLGLTAMLPAIRAGVGEMARLRQAAHDVGYVMDDALIEKAGEANDKFEALQQIIGVQIHSAFVDLAPLVLEVTEALAEAAKAARGLTVNPKFIEGLRLAAGYAAAVGKGGALGGAKFVREHAGDLTQLSRTPNDVDWSRFDSPDRSFKTGPERSGTSLGRPSSGGGSRGPRDRSDDVIAAAARAEIAARLGLTNNIEEIARLKAEQVQQETDDANAALRRQVAEGQISKAAAATAKSLNDRANTERLALIEREKVADLDEQEFRQRQEIAGIYDRIAGINADAAGTAAERNRIEADNLKENQRLDRQELVAKLARQVASGEITESYQKERLAAQDDLDAAEKKKQAREAQARVVNEALAADMAELDRQMRLAQVQADLERTVVGRRNAQLKLLQLALEEYRREKQRIIDDPMASDGDKEQARKDQEQADREYEARRKLIERENSLEAVFREAEYNVEDVAAAFKRHDWLRLLDGLKIAIEGLEKAFGEGGTLGDKVASIAGIASAVGQVVGGKAGRAVSSAANAGMAAFTLSGGNPVVAALAAATAGLAELLKGKPSNHAGITTLTQDGYAFHSSGKENEQTKDAVIQTSKAILAGQDAYAAAGITIKKFVTGIDLGTRDLTHIFLSSGEELRSAVGDPAAAAETALKAVLEGAEYVDETQRKLVESMLATGKGFDDINAALQGYAAAQKVADNISDAILQLTDPKAFDLKGVKQAIKDQRESAKAAYDAGMLTAEALAAINAQLDTLEGLQLADVMKRYGEVTAKVADAQDALREAYEAEADVLRGVIDRYSEVAESLRDFGAELAGASGSQADMLAAAETAFNALVGKTDADSLGKLQGASQAYLNAGMAGARDEVEAARIQARVRNAVEAGAKTAQSQADLAQQQLDALTDQVSKLVEINASVLSVVQAIADLKAAMAEAGAKPGSNDNNPAANSNNAAAGAYLALYGDVAASASGGWLGGVDVGDLTGDGEVNALDRAMWHFQNYGKPEGRKFAGGGGFQVGGFGGTDSKLVNMLATPGEYVSVSHGDPMAGMAAEMREMRSDLNAGLYAIARNTSQVARMNKRWNGDGLPPTRS